MHIQAPPVPAWQRLIRRLAATRPASGALSRLLPALDRAVMVLSGGKRTLTGLLAGLPVVYLTSYGAVSGKTRICPLLGIPDGERLILVASNFGGRRHPSWYRNLLAHPACLIAFNGKASAYRASEAQGEERARCWAQAVKLYPGFEAYVRRAAGRRIPVMVLTQVRPQGAPAGEKVDGR